MRIFLRAALVLAATTCFHAVASAKEPVTVAADQAATGRLTIQDVLKLGAVSDPQISPDGKWIAYVVSRMDLEKDESRSRIWMVAAKEGEAIPVTAEAESSSSPRWSPDGRYLAFISGRDEAPAQVWRLFREGGEAEQLTDTAQDVQDFEWSPDSRFMALVLRDPSAQQLAAKQAGENYEEKTAPPWVIDRLQFKEDYVGYLDRRRTHIYSLNVGTRAVVQLTTGDFDDEQPAFSPDGKRIAFISNRSQEPDDNYNTDIWIANADPAPAPAPLVQVSTSPGRDDSPAWSPDGTSIAHTAVVSADFADYATSHLAVSRAAGGETRVLTAALDRMIFEPEFSPDGKSIWFLVEDHGEQNLARIGLRGGKVERLVRGENVVTDFNFGTDGNLAALVSTPALPHEVFTFRKGKLEQRTFTNRELLSRLRLGATEKVSYQSQDGTVIEGFVIKPVGFEEGKRYPAILDIHGGPQMQYDYSFNFEAQLYAANGYVVIHPNPRGSTGYGQQFSAAIWRDWGGPDYFDVMAGVDDAIARGWADPNRLGVSGWSYGGILTNHVITKTDRFKAAISGASEVLYVVNFGHDHYQRWWTQELGLPWEPEARARYERMSPFNSIDKVVTPTLILGGEDDWNVPIINSEQMYLALRKLGVETQLIVYPGESHGIDTPSHFKDLYERYLDWFGKRL